MAGPNHRAGFIAAPVKGPPIKMSIVIVMPIANPPTAWKDPLGSIPVPNTTKTKKNVRTASTTIPVAGEGQGEGRDDLGDGLPERIVDQPRAPKRPQVAARDISTFLFDGPDTKGAHAKYDADPRSNPGTNSRRSSEGCHAASGKTRLGKNRPVSPEICVTMWSGPKRVSR